MNFPLPSNARARAFLGGLLALATLDAQAEFWSARAPVPGARAAHSAVWTGRELIVWGGGIDGVFLDTGARYTPLTDSWRITSTVGAPEARWFHAAVWTGREMIVWGGRSTFEGTSNHGDGARYNPETDTWRPVSQEGAPSPRSQCASVWTGREMIVWGGAGDGFIEQNDGARYNPDTDTWTPLSNGSGLEPRMEPSGIWTGSEFIVFGGSKFTGGQLSFGNGARYRPITDSWRPLPAIPGSPSRTGHTAVWTGERMIVWGGREVPAQLLLNNGAIYEPGLNQWTPLAGDQALPGRMYHASVWTGSEMIVWGGENIEGDMLSSGARFRPSSGQWTATTLEGVAGKRQFWRPDLGIWTGEAMVIAAGSDYPASLDSTYLYFPEGETPTPPDCVAPSSGLAVSWSFEGTASDQLNGTLLQLTGDPAYGRGKVAQGLHFDGRDDEASAPASAVLDLGITDGFSIEFWVKPAQIDRQPLVEWKAVPGSWGVHLWLGVASPGSLYVNLAEVGGAIHLVSSAADLVVVDVFQHVGMSYDKPAGLVRLYVNGRKVTEEFVGSFTPQTARDLLVGYRQGEEHFRGALDELAFYGRALSDAEFAAVAAAGAAGKCITPPGVFDVSHDFSPTSNPAGNWSYGYLATLDGPFTLLTFAKTFFANNGAPISGWQVSDNFSPSVNRVGEQVAISEGGAFTAQPGTVYVWPGNPGSPGNFGAIQFQVPAGGSAIYKLFTSVRPTFDGPTSGDTDFHVRRNGQELFGQFLGPNTGTTYSNVLALAVGDTIDFVVGRGADGSADHSSLKVQASLTRLTSSPPVNCVPSPSGLVGWWAGEDNAVDVLGRHPGSLVGNVTFAPGMVGHGFYFDGSGGYVRIPNDDALDFLSELTVELWYKHEGSPDEAYGLVSTRGTETGPVNYAISVIPIGIGPYFNDPAVATGDDAEQGSAFEASRSLPVPSSGVFHHLAVSFWRTPDNQVELKTFVDGVLVRTKRLAAELAASVNDAAIVIGRSAEYGEELFHGVIDEVSLYRRALTADEIQVLATAGGAGKCLDTNAVFMDRLFTLVNTTPLAVEIEPLRAKLGDIAASLAYGNVRAAIHQIDSFQRKVSVLVLPTAPEFALTLVELSEQLIESLDPQGARRQELDDLSAMPARVLHVFRTEQRLRFVSSAPPGSLCRIERSSDLREWTTAGPAAEVSDGIYQWLDIPSEHAANFYRLVVPGEE